MGRSPCCSKIGLKRGAWSAKEDALLAGYVQKHGEGEWRSLPKKAGLLRCGKSCRLRWVNYLRPGIKRGNIGEDEEDLIVRLHGLLGNRWSLIAGRLPCRTDNEIKNYWNTHLVKKLKIDPPRAAKSKKSAGEPPLKKAKRTKGDMPKKIKVYAPKPMRVSSSFGRGLSSGSDCGGEANTHAPAPLPWSNLFDLEDFPFEDVGLLPADQQSDSAGDFNMLDIVFDEFRQLV